MLRTDSLAFRLIAIAAIWSLVGLIVGSFLLSSLFTQSAEQSFDERLMADIESIVAVSELDCDGTFTMPKPLFAERFMNLLSGSYWQVSSVDETAPGKPRQVMKSPSLQFTSLPIGKLVAVGAVSKSSIIGPSNDHLRMVEQVVSIPSGVDDDPSNKCQGNKSYRIAVASDAASVEEDVANFNSILFWSNVVLAVGLVGAMVLQVRLGLAPLNRVSRSLAAIREGRADRLEGQFPAEIMPLADELNALVAHNAEVVARARTHVGNLAHFLKTPLSVLANEAQGETGPLAEAVARQVQVMRRQVDHYLARARTVASAGVIGARTDAAPVVADLTRALSRIYLSRGIHIEGKCREGSSFRGDRADFEEMLGNLLDNACKWAERDVTIAVAPSRPGRLRVVVADDGPGLNEDQKERVLERGERLDESKPGSGLGLDIVKEIASLYGGKLELNRAPAGGLSAELDLPSADRAG